MKGNENTARRSHPNLPPDGKGGTHCCREVSPIQANHHFKDFVPLVQEGPDQFVAPIVQGAPINVNVTLSAEGGTLSADTVTIAAGAISSEPVTVSADDSQRAQVTISVATALFEGWTEPYEPSGACSCRGFETGAGAPLTITVPTISGNAQVGQTLTANTSGLDGATFSYQWVANDSTGDSYIQNATGSTYTVSSDDEGKTIKVRVTFTDGSYNGQSVTSGATTPVTPDTNNLPTGLPVIGGTARVGQTLTAGTSDIADADGRTNAVFTYQWLSNDRSVDTEVQDATSSTHTLTDADVGNIIRVRVSFNDDTGTIETLTSDPTAAVEYVPGPPEVPGDVSVTAGVELLNVSWTPPANENKAPIEGYRIRYRESGGSYQEEQTTQLTHTIEGLDSGVTYNVQVAARNASGYGEYSEQISVAPLSCDTAGLAKPLNLSGQAIYHLRVELDWDDVPCADSYEVRLHDYVTVGDWVDLPNGEVTVSFNGSSVVVDNLPEGIFWFLQVRAINSTENSEWSDVLQLLPTKQSKWNRPAEGAPTISGTAQVSEELMVGTSAISDEDGRQEAQFSYQWVSNDGHADSNVVDATDSTYVVSNDDVGKTLKVRVTFIDDMNNEETLTSAATATVTAKPNSPATGLPTISGTAKAGQTLTASTSDITDADGLENPEFSYQWVSNDGTRDANIEGATALTYAVSDDDVGKTIKVRVSFTDGRGNQESLTSDPTTPVTAAGTSEIHEDTATDYPTNLAATWRNGSVRLTWNAPTVDAESITAYRINRNSRHVVDRLGTRTNYVDNEATDAGSEYTYCIQAVRTAANISDCSNNASVTIRAETTGSTTPETVPETGDRHPTNLVVSLVNGVVVLNWDAPTADAESVTGYEILRRRPNKGESTLVPYGEVSEGTAFTDPQANEPGVKYTYRVKALRGEDKSQWSNYANITIPDATTETPPQETTPEPEPGNSHPTNLTVSLVDGVVTLTWDAPTEDAESVTGYEILRRRPDRDAVGEFHSLVADTQSTATTYTDATASEPGVKYTYRVKALRGEEKSKWSNYDNITIPE